MRSLFRPAGNRLAELFLLLTYALLTAAPFLPALLGHPLDHPWRLLSFQLLAWLAVWSVFQRPAWFHWLLIPAFLALPTEIYLLVFYGQGISTHHLGIIVETSPKEALEFLGQKIWLMGAVMLGVLVWCGLAWYCAVRTRRLDWRGRSRPAVLVLLLLPASLWLYGAEFGYRASAAKNSAGKPEVASVAGAEATELDWPALPHWARLPYVFDTVSNAWPFACWRAAMIFTVSAPTWPNWASAATAFISARISRIPIRSRKWW